MAKNNLVGKLAYYHGSVLHAHGYVIVESTHRPYLPLNDTDTIRYVLRYGPGRNDFLTNVRPMSFYRVDKEGFKK